MNEPSVNLGDTLFGANLGFGSPVPPDMTEPLRIVDEELEGLQGKLMAAMGVQTAPGRKFVAELNQKLVNRLGETLANGRETIDYLSAKTHSALAENLREQLTEAENRGIESVGPEILSIIGPEGQILELENPDIYNRGISQSATTAEQSVNQATSLPLGLQGGVIYNGSLYTLGPNGVLIPVAGGAAQSGIPDVALAGMSPLPPLSDRSQLTFIPQPGQTPQTVAGNQLWTISGPDDALPQPGNGRPGKPPADCPPCGVCVYDYRHPCPPDTADHKPVTDDGTGLIGDTPTGRVCGPVFCGVGATSGMQCRLAAGPGTPQQRAGIVYKNRIYLCDANGNVPPGQWPNHLDDEPPLPKPIGQIRQNVRPNQQFRNLFRGWQANRSPRRYITPPFAESDSPNDFLLSAGTGRECVQDAIGCPPDEDYRPESSPGFDVGSIPGVGGSGEHCLGVTEIPLPENATNVFEIMAGVSNRKGFTQADVERLSGCLSDNGWLKWLFPTPKLMGELSAGLTLLIEDLVAAFGCVEKKGAYGTVLQSVIGFFERWIAGPLPVIDWPILYSNFFHCPVLIPTTDQATNAYLTNSIDKELLDCWVKSNGNKVAPWDKIVDSRRSRFTWDTLLELHRRGVIDEDKFKARTRELGYIKPDDQKEMLAFFNAIPPISDLIRFMVRDVADEVNVDWSTADALFQDKWAGKVKDWSISQGITEEYAKSAWRAHFSIPSPTQLLEFWHRLRYREGFGGKAALWNDVRNALIQQDILPKWIPHFEAISFKPLTRVDAKRAFEIGSLSERGLWDAFIDQGYSDENANTLVDFTKRQLVIRQRKHRAVKAWARLEITTDEATQLMSADGVPDEVITDALRLAEIERRSLVRRRCINAIRKRYARGELDDQELRDELERFGLEPVQISAINVEAQCERSARGKVAPASTLCQWFDAGLIDANTYHRYLVNIGWDGIDAGRHVGLCRTRMAKREQKEFAAKQRQDEAALRRSQMEQDKARRQAEARAREAARKATAAAKNRERRDNEMIKATVDLAGRVDLPLGTVAAALRRAVQAVKDAGIYGIDDATQAATIAAKSYTERDLSGLSAAAIEVAQAEEIGSPDTPIPSI